MSDMLDKVNHRPWPLPKGPGVVSQECHDLLFAHWSVSIDSLRQTVPFSLPIDTFDGRPWIGITFFRTARARLRGLPPIPWLSAFLALNVRTYVTMDGKPGVYFLSLDTSNRLVAAVARWTFPLPYFHARMSLTQVGDSLHCSSSRRRDSDAPAEFVGSYRAVGPIVYPARESLDYWLTERYCLYAVDPNHRICRTEIHHLPWPLQQAEAEVHSNTMLLSHGLDPVDRAPLLHVARGLEILVWPPKRINS